MASKTGWASAGEPPMILRISAVALCCSSASASRLTASALSLRASASRFSRSRTLAPSSLGDLRATGGLAPLDLAGFESRRISLPLTAYESAGDRLGEPVNQGKG